MKASLAPLAAIAVALAAAAPAGRDASAPRSQSRDAAAPREAGPDGMLVLAVLSPERALVADPRTGATSARVLPGGTLCHGPLFAVGGRMLLSGSRGGRAVALAAPLERRGHARALGPAQLIVPSATPGRVWLGSWTQADHVAGRLTLREVDTAGRVRAQTSRWLPRWSGLEAEIDGGFLMTDYHGVVLRGPKRVRIRDAWPIAAAGSRFAWCDDPCRRVGIWDAGTRRSFDPPRGLRPQLAARAAFSPDGSASRSRQRSTAVRAPP